MTKLNFDRTIAGVNITENGIKSYTKSIKLGPIQLTLNARKSGILGSLSIPGTGVSFRNIKLFWRTMDFTTRVNKEEQLRSLIMKVAIQDPNCIEGFLSNAIESLSDKDLDLEINLWSK